MRVHATDTTGPAGVAPAVVAERILAYRFALDLNQAQTRAALSHVGARRFAYNHMLALVRAILDQREAERSYGVSDELLTPYVGWSAYSLRKAWNARKGEAAPWWAENSKEAYADGCARLAAALSNWSKARQNKRKGAAGFPRFAARRGRQSVTFTAGAFRVDDRRHVVLPTIGRVRTHEDTTRLATLISAGTARITRATLAFERGRWFVSFGVRQQVAAAPARHRVTAPVGVDVGVRDLLVVADGDGVELERVRAPRHLAQAQHRLRALQRKAARQVGPYDPETQRSREPSARWRATQALVSRAHAKVANLREDALHQATTRLAKTYAHIVIEDLHVRGMTAAGGARKRGLNRAIADASFGELARMLDYKTCWNGGTLTRADRWFPSSKTCSTCGTAKATLSLAERTFECTTCGTRIDRDLNAAINLARIPRAPAGVPGRDASGATQKTSPRLAAGNEAGTCDSRSAT